MTSETLALRSWHIAHRYPQALARDLSARERQLDVFNDIDRQAWLRYWNRNPVAAFIGSSKGGSSNGASSKGGAEQRGASQQKSTPWFQIQEDKLQPIFHVAPDEREQFESMLLELCELRMAEYIDRG